jgi:hypothetical protein
MAGSPAEEFSGSFAREYFLLGFCATRFDDDLHGIFHWIFEGHLNPKQASWHPPF